MRNMPHDPFVVEPPEDEAHLAPVEATTPRAIVWARRRQAVARMWRTYRHNKMGVAGLILLVFFITVALGAPLLANSRGLNAALATGPRMAPPSWRYPFGTDEYGRNLLVLTIWGTRISLIIGLFATLITIGIGSTIGLLAGFKGGWMDSLLMRFTDWFLVIPWLAFAIVLCSLLGQSLGVIIFVIGVTSWAWVARLVRSQTLSIRERPFVELARARGATDFHLLTHHVLPNVFPVIFANTVLTVSYSILGESGLSFLGLGDPTRISWGAILDGAFGQGAAIAGQWGYVVFPGVCIVAVVLAFTMCGYALDEIVNPRLRER